MNLLIVNDEVLTAETMKVDIQWNNYGIDEVYTAYDAEQAKQVIEMQEVDIMLCDIEMPGENGIDLYRWVREGKMEIECIFLTCHASFDYALDAIQLGCRNYLLIPAKYEDIGNEVRKIVGQLTIQREAMKYQEYGRQVVDSKINQAAGQFGGKKTAEEIVKDTVQYIAENIGSETLSVNEIADTFHMHPVYLNRIFKKKREFSIGKYIIAEKMKLAGELLKSGKLPANIVAEQVGYSSYPNFHLMFKKYYGCSPSQYQNREDS